MFQLQVNISVLFPSLPCVQGNTHLTTLSTTPATGFQLTCDDGVKADLKHIVVFSSEGKPSLSS